MIKWKIYVVLATLIGSALLTAGVYVKHLQAKLEGLEREKQALIQSLKVEREKLEFEQQQNDLAVERITALERDRKDSAAVVQEIRDVFQKREFGTLAAKKPGLVTIKMQKATQKVLDELKAVTAIPGD